MQDFYKTPVIGDILLGLKILIKSVLKLIKHPQLFVFYIYSTIMSSLSLLLIIWTEKVIFIALCWASKWKYLPLSNSISCQEGPVKQLMSGLENIVHFRDFSQIIKHIKDIFSAKSTINFFTSTLIFLIFSASIIGYFLFIHYFHYFSFTAMARYINKLEKNSEKTSPLASLSLDEKTTQRIWRWTLFSTLLFTSLRLLFSYALANAPLYYLCQAYKIGYTPFASTLIMLISFYAGPLLAYEDLSLKQLIKKLFILIKKAPIATLTITIILSLTLYLLPSCMLPKNYDLTPLQHSYTASIWGLLALSYFLMPISQILLYRSINKFETP